MRRNKNHPVFNAARALNPTESKYALTLAHPWKFTGQKIPSMAPIPSSVTRVKQTIFVTPNGSGLAKVALIPWNPNNVLYVWNGSVFTEGSTAGPDSSFGTPPISQTNAIAVRVVSAGLRIYNATNSLNASGIVTLTAIPTSTGTLSFDSIRDYPDTRTITGEKAKLLYTPVDNSLLEFKATPVNIPAQALSLIACISGSSASQQYAVEFIVNYEFIPATGYTDLLAPSKAGAGKPEASTGFLSKVEEFGSSIGHNLEHSFEGAISILSAIGNLVETL